MIQVDDEGLAPSRRRTPRPEVRERVLRAAARVFADRGFAAASIDDVAAAAGFTKGAVYSNFASKDELFFALMDQQVAERVSLFTGLVAELSEATDVADLIARHLVDSVVDSRDWQLLFLEFWQRAMRDPDTHKRFLVRRRELHHVVADEFQKALDSGRIRSAASARALTFVVLGVANGLAIEELLDPGTAPRGLARQLLTALIADEPARLTERRDGQGVPGDDGSSSSRLAGVAAPDPG